MQRLTATLVCTHRRFGSRLGLVIQLIAFVVGDDVYIGQRLGVGPRIFFTAVDVVALALADLVDLDAQDIEQCCFLNGRNSYYGWAPSPGLTLDVVFDQLASDTRCSAATLCSLHSTG